MVEPCSVAEPLTAVTPAFVPNQSLHRSAHETVMSHAQGLHRARQRLRSTRGGHEKAKRRDFLFQSFDHRLTFRQGHSDRCLSHIPTSYANNISTKRRFNQFFFCVSVKGWALVVGAGTAETSLSTSGMRVAAAALCNASERASFDRGSCNK